MKTRHLLLLSALVLLACTRKTAVDENLYKLDFRYAPVWGQTSICLPDEVQKTIVDDQGTVYYDYYNIHVDGRRQNGPFNGFNIAMAAGIEDTEPSEVNQHLYSAKVPVVLTTWKKNGIQVSSDIFAVAPALKTDSADICELSVGYWGTPHNDIILLRLKNTSGSDTTVAPEFTVRSVLPVQQSTDLQSLSIDRRITVTLPSGAGKITEEPLGSNHLYTVTFHPVFLKPGEEKPLAFAVNIGAKAAQLPASVRELSAYETKAVQFWDSYPLPYNHITVPDTAVQDLLWSCIRNIYQAREIKNGLPAFQVGPTCYRGLWIIDGSFLLESQTFLGNIPDVRNGIEYMLSFQHKDGSFMLIKDHWKETGIVLWVIKRHAQLTGDTTWLSSKWDNVARAVAFIDSMRHSTMKDKNAVNYGLVPAGFSDGGLAKKTDEFTNVYWTLIGLKSAVHIAEQLNRNAEATQWQAKYDSMFTDFRRAAERSLRTDSCGNWAIPTYMTDSCPIQKAQWAFCHAVYPGELFADDDLLMLGTMNMLRCHEREGLVYETGWQDQGVWNYFGSFYAHAWLWLGDDMKAAQTMYAMANHASHTLVWREEQPVKTVKSRQVTGDMPHNWASAEFIRMIRHFIALERGPELHLFEGLPPTWLKPGMRTAIKGIYTDYGILDAELAISADGKKATVSMNLNPANHQPPSSVVIHLNTPGGKEKVINIKPVFPFNKTFSL